MPATLVCRSASVRLTAESFTTEQGWVSEILERETDPLRTPGVPGTRLRVNRADWPEFDATVLVGADSWASALYKRRQLTQMVGRVMDLTLVGGSITGTWTDVLVHACRPVAVPGALVGSTSYTHHVNAVLRLQLTSTP